MPASYNLHVCGRQLFVLCFLFTLGACATSPRDSISASAQRYGMQESEVRSAQFTHVIYRNYRTQEQLDTLNVYLEGDGIPWILRYFRSTDPTPRSALMLRLMAKDPAPSLYLGRPCYNERVRSKNCGSEHWTSGRYSTVVVESMAAVLTQEMERLNVKSINLYGHSGGGALALLLAEQIPAVSRVLTLAGNLDTDAWTSHHGYSRLYTSLNPARRLALPARVEQIHLMGGRDSNIPPSLVRNWVNMQRNSYGVTFDEFDHGCCWSRIWRDVLSTLHAGPPYRFSGRVFKTPLKANSTLPER